MNRGLLTKTFHETYRGTLLFAFALVTFETIIARVIPSFQDQLAGPLFSNPFFRNIIQALLGSALGQNIGPAALYAMGWVHPVVLTLVWAHEVMFCTRVPVGELDRGTGDVLFALPVTRWQIYVNETIACLVSGVILVACLPLGNYLGTVSEDAPGFDVILIAVVNLYAVYLAVAGLALAVSALSRRRGRAIGVVFAVVLSSFFLSFLVQFWPSAEAISWVGLLHYYRPMEIMSQEIWPVGDILVLSGFGLVAWILGGLALARRDL